MRHVATCITCSRAACDNYHGGRCESVRPSELKPLDHIRELRCPIFVIGGAEDRHTTEAETRLLYEAASTPKGLWLIPGTGHVDFFEAAGDEYRRRVLGFLAVRLLKGQ